FRQLDTLILVYNSIVRSKFEYAAIIRHGLNATQTEKLEKVQKSFLRYLYYRKHGVHPHYDNHPVRTSSMLEEFHLSTLEKRRNLNDAMFLY
ncbi:hypothetical protein NL389_35150, partial [Klebsiella pneumoniae]|nr:hypothetical protein [Klebsiella pneumoniae]